MLSITTKSPYALRALTELARMGADAPVPIGELARRREIPVQFLEQLFAVLRRAGPAALPARSQGRVRVRARARPTSPCSSSSSCSTARSGNGAVGIFADAAAAARAVLGRGHGRRRASSASRARPARRCTTSRRGTPPKAVLGSRPPLDSARTRSNPLESGAHLPMVFPPVVVVLPFRRNLLSGPATSPRRSNGANEEKPPAGPADRSSRIQRLSNAPPLRRGIRYV